MQVTLEYIPCVTSALLDVIILPGAPASEVLCFYLVYCCSGYPVCCLPLRLTLVGMKSGACGGGGGNGGGEEVRNFINGAFEGIKSF